MTAILNTITRIIQLCTDEQDSILHPDLGELSFNLSSTLGQINNLLSPLNKINLTGYPEPLFQEFKNTLNETLQALEDIKKFNITSVSDPKRVKESLSSRVINLTPKLFTTIHPLLSHLSFNMYIEDNRIKKIVDKISKYEALISKTNKEASEALKEIKLILESSQKIAGDLVVNEYSKVFNEEYQTHEKSAKSWLIATVGILTLLVGFGYYLLYYAKLDATGGTPMIVQFTVTKVLVLTVLFYALNLCTKNYKSHKHNSILNKHRRNALSTFQTFVSAAGDSDQTKNAVLLEATRTIFSNQPTGYSNNENEAEFPSRIIEIIKNKPD